MMAIAIAPGPAAPLLSRKPERLLVEGYRAWLNGYETGSIDCWERGWTVYLAELGSADARRIYGEVSWWVRQTRAAAGRALTCFPYGCQCLCRDECLLVSFVAAVQNGDLEAQRRCVVHLAADGRADMATAAARDLSAAFDGIHQRLFPVPADVIDDIAGRPCSARFN
ncbi:hypothetical protein [Methylobrevis pamukkalensis]|uniref:Uncharacterized protein n=1 Tax=Methylobrevis pamukkalensis TaxID=1439726 RepID=A0A1E3H6W0_9HYPH|nr:hypothetical protein [Methylobrevis pamukkalensis]ODN71885.1 hypothetical protein A6302_00817 [Methylobrevis pamukkalensis]